MIALDHNQFAVGTRDHYLRVVFRSYQDDHWMLSIAAHELTPQIVRTLRSDWEHYKWGCGYEQRPPNVLEFVKEEVNHYFGAVLCKLRGHVWHREYFDPDHFAVICLRCGEEPPDYHVS